MVLVKVAISVALTPSWPAFSATFAISSALAGRVRASSLSWPSSCSNWAGLASTVLSTPAQADSHSIAALTANPSPAVMAAPATTAPVESLSQAWVFSVLSRSCSTLALAFSTGVVNPSTVARNRTSTSLTLTGSPSGLCGRRTWQLV